MKQKTKEENTVDILKRIAKRVEEASVDVNDIKFDLKSIKARLGNVEHNTAVMKIDMEKLREQLEKTEARLDKRIMNVGDLITIAFTKRFEKVEKRVSKLEHQQAVA
ncbi:MAG: hypothetical protein HY429_00355 [Candidatus Levybacteria bacterium]|nr:hypothetical protein [Candidatus Levybacteria bacterium]